MKQKIETITVQTQPMDHSTPLNCLPNGRVARKTILAWRVGVGLEGTPDWRIKTGVRSVPDKYPIRYQVGKCPVKKTSKNTGFGPEPPIPAASIRNAG